MLDLTVVFQIFFSITVRKHIYVHVSDDSAREAAKNIIREKEHSSE
jgi:hypothetical protein